MTDTETNLSPPSDSSVLRQLDRILRSKTFVQSEKLCRFLRFVVEHVLAGDGTCLKEYLVGVEVYDRKPPYDPSQDSIVRTEARRLRNKLKEYYGTEGEEDTIFIYLRPGSYAPVFHSRQELTGDPSPIASASQPQEESTSFTIAILPFQDATGSAASAAFTRAIPDELAYVLMRVEGCRVISPLSTASLHAGGWDFAAAMKSLRARIAFEGSVRVAGPHLRVTARILDQAGAQLWLKRLDIDIESEASFGTEEQVAKALSAGLDVVRSL